jgi:hypothetical protein
MAEPGGHGYPGGDGGVLHLLLEGLRHTYADRLHRARGTATGDRPLSWPCRRVVHAANPWMSFPGISPPMTGPPAPQHSPAHPSIEDTSRDFASLSCPGPPARPDAQRPRPPRMPVAFTAMHAWRTVWGYVRNACIVLMDIRWWLKMEGHRPIYETTDLVISSLFHGGGCGRMTRPAAHCER